MRVVEVGVGQAEGDACVHLDNGSECVIYRELYEALCDWFKQEPKRIGTETSDVEKELIDKINQQVWGEKQEPKKDASEIEWSLDGVKVTNVLLMEAEWLFDAKNIDASNLFWNTTGNGEKEMNNEIYSWIAAIKAPQNSENEFAGYERIIGKDSEIAANKEVLRTRLIARLAPELDGDEIDRLEIRIGLA